MEIVSKMKESIFFFISSPTFLFGAIDERIFVFAIYLLSFFFVHHISRTSHMRTIGNDEYFCSCSL